MGIYVPFSESSRNRRPKSTLVERFFGCKAHDNRALQKSIGNTSVAESLLYKKDSNLIDGQGEDHDVEELT